MRREKMGKKRWERRSRWSDSEKEGRRKGRGKAGGEREGRLTELDTESPSISKPPLHGTACSQHARNAAQAPEGLPYLARYNEYLCVLECCSHIFCLV